MTAVVKNMRDSVGDVLGAWVHGQAWTAPTHAGRP
ncbi:hypothetical protein Caci_3463 [Catenulispora acidiphila DSM 44928]|uniref:Uncharacterized protein n=1 Tax=Catenulispora acidiphila (strain DSM 44928 / JCM 14897 / NBRC 102108 / NRRL B-24433 / ID139908) TaxID=479433 RepID=C7Q949_CATAD|nr:hypothetical protein Caci_3463 [Catenulispora acidiphila DSM 44928]